MALLMLFLFGPSAAQPEVMAWGNLTGIRVDGQLMDFETSLRVVDRGWLGFNATGMERQQPIYDREGAKQTVTTKIGGIKFSEIVEECGSGCATITIRSSAERDTSVQGSFFCITLDGKNYANATVRFINGSAALKSKIFLVDISEKDSKRPFRITTNGILIEAGQRNLEIIMRSATTVYLRRESENSDPEIFFALAENKIKRGIENQKTFTIKASGTIDKSPVEIVLDAQKPGRRFDGLGGNFRLQNPSTDPQVIEYCLDNMRVAWGRVEMPWYAWHPDEKADPLEAARAGTINPHVKASMEMAQKLARLGMPVIVSDWGAPAWAILGDPMDAFRFRSKGIYGYQLNPQKMDKIYLSIGAYLLYLKENFGVEAAMFSFNESDLGINVRHTGKEHSEFIKGLGAHLASLGLTTKLLLGDNSDATTFDFIIPAMNDPEAYKYIGAVSFHSWRGCTDEILRKWAGAARQLNLPLIVGEGSTDAAAWNYPEIFSEQSFALNEINLYTRICAICQPLSILQWQLTADYSVLTGGGIFGTHGPLHPTQRFWNLKQLASTPAGAFSIPFTCSKKGINCAAFGNKATGEFAVHIVNNGAQCPASLKGIPSDISSFDIYQTDNIKAMQKVGEVKVINGNAEFVLDKSCFTTFKSRRN